ncbi:MAG: ABC transporter ATP-binding protein/permease [Patescibacteria group bacterium]|jgi:ABC-type bacteriocin/lantibiotic exporter with double-glycine peptidase domain|nr:ABC transporter ATP-binding protein/permease [Patescibacteria group bacterium]
MMPKLYEAIEKLVTNGVPTQYIPSMLVQAGWPSVLVNQAVEAWMQSHGRSIQKTGFNKWLKKYYKLAAPAVFAVVLINLIADAITLLKPWPLKILADSAFGNLPAPGPLEPYTQTPTLIAIVSLISIALFVTGALFGYIQDFLLLKIGFWLNRGIKYESLNHILHLPLYHQERLAKGDYVYRQNIVTNSLSDLVLATTSSIIGSVIMIIAIVAIMLNFSVTLTLFTLVLIPLLFVTMKLVGPRLGQYNQALTELASDTASKVTESVDNAETVQAFTLERKQLSTVDRLWNLGYQYTKKSMFWGKILEDGNGLLIILATSAVMYFGGSAALRGEISFGDLLVFMTYLGYLLSPVQELVGQITTRNKKLIDVHRIYEVLTDHEGIENIRQDNHLAPNIKGKITFENVSYKYKDNLVLDKLNLVINSGEKVAIIGPSGGGKSTILKLIPLFIEPDQGRIMIDLYDTQTVSLRELRNKITWVSQTPQLFDGTILDNLYDADIERQINSDEIMQAIDVSNVTEFATHLPLGLETPTGENGGSLSGGQRQRVAIARSLLRNSPIICLDEPTAALDAKSEIFIKDNLPKMISGKTVVMVTHRKALLELMDTIYVLENRTLTNVNELGGLDSYLAKLEGLVIQDNTNQNPTIGTDSADLTENLTSANNMNISDDYVDPLNNQSKIDTEYEQQNLTIDHPPTETNDMTIKIDHKDND